MPNSKSPLRYLLSGAGIQLVALVVSAIIGFLLTPLMIHTLGDRDYGLLVLVGSFAGWLAMVDFGLSGAVTRFVAVNFSQGKQDESTAYASTGFFLYLGLGLVAFTLAALATLSLPWLMTDQADIPLVRTLVLLSAAGFAVEMPIRALSGLMNGYMRRDISSSLVLLGRVLRSGATVSILLCGGRLIAITAGALLAAVLMALLWWRVVKWVLPSFEFNARVITRQKLRSLFSFGGVSFIGHTAEAVIFRLDSFVIAWFVAVAAVPHYVIASTLVSYFQMTMVAITGWLLNWFAHKQSSGKDAISESLYMATRYSVIVGGFCLFGLIAFGRPFIERWMGPDYLDAYPCLVALAVAEFVRGAMRPKINLLLANAKHHIYASTRVVEAILNVVLSILLVQQYGILGVALGTMIASLVVNGLLFPVLSCLATDGSLVQYSKAVLHGLLVATLLVTVPALIVTSTIKPDYGTLLFLGMVSALLYFPLAVALGASQSERKRILASYLG